uniref:Uncharacterized protein n=1 Tax=Malurus cyaneus samueli TaxID=2593467 RepID=A0A8C5TY32_9PASS
MVQAMIPKSLRPMKFYFSTVYQEIWVGVALTSVFKKSQVKSFTGCHDQ